MRTNIVIDDKLMADAMAAGGFKTKREAVEEGLRLIKRRKAYAAIKTAFDANGIRFAFPTVQVAGGAESSVAAAAQQMLAGSKPAPAN